jgi:hypothetical protein
VAERGERAGVAHFPQPDAVMGTMGAVGPFNDAFRRHLFTSAVRLANISGRREIPQ